MRNRLSVSSFATSEETLGHPFFVRKNRQLVLTEAGQMALQFADSIFRAGGDWFDTLQHRSRRARQVLRVGAVATLSRNFQWEFVKPLRNRRDVELVLRSGVLRDLIVQLRNHEVDVVLSNHALRRGCRKPNTTAIFSQSRK